MKKTILSINIMCVLAIIGHAQTIKTNGTQMTFDVNQTCIVYSISNAFDQWQYRGMDLESAKYNGSVPGWKGTTNGWILFPLSGQIAQTKWKNTGKLVPYIGTFYITVQSLTSNQTVVTVQTINSRVIHGKEIGLHGGWANHEVNVAPVFAEETNVLAAISNAVFTTYNHNHKLSKTESDAPTNSARDAKED